MKRKRQVTLRAARQRKKLTQAELADRSKVPQATISKLETGQLVNPRWNDVVDLAAALEMDPAQLRFGAAPEAVAS